MPNEREEKETQQQQKNNQADYVFVSQIPFILHIFNEFVSFFFLHKDYHLSFGASIFLYFCVLYLL